MKALFFTVVLLFACTSVRAGELTAPDRVALQLGQLVIQLEQLRDQNQDLHKQVELLQQRLADKPGDAAKPKDKPE